MNSVEPQTMKKDSVILKYTLICMYVCILFFKNKIKNIDGDKSLHDLYVRIIKGRPEIPGGQRMSTNWISTRGLK